MTHDMNGKVGEATKDKKGIRKVQKLHVYMKREGAHLPPFAGVVMAIWLSKC